MKVAFFRGRHPGFKGWFGVAVKWWTRGPFSHVELVADAAGDHALCWSSAFLDGGVRPVVVDLTTSDWTVIEVATTPEQEAAALQWFASHRGQRYDVLGLFGFVLRRIDGDKNKWFCSEAVAAALGYGQPWRLDPNTFYEVLLARLQPGSEVSTVAAALTVG